MPDTKTRAMVDGEEGLHLDGEKARVADTIPGILIYEAGLIFSQSTQPREGYPGGKYPDDADGRPNFKGGIKVTKILDSMWRHWCCVLLGEDIDPDSGFHHLSHIICNVAMCWHMVKRKPAMDNREPDLEALAALRAKGVL